MSGAALIGVIFCGVFAVAALIFVIAMAFKPPPFH